MTLALLVVVLAQTASPGLVKQVASARVTLAQTIAQDPEIVAAVTAKNAEKESAETIQKRDHEWMTRPDSPLRKALTASPCAERLRALVREDPLVVEVILMDAQGANVCVSRETTDYWQGDEAKWQQPYQKGREIFVDEPAYDESSKTYAVQLSVPVARAGRRIGALTLTLRVRHEDLPAAR